MIRIVFCCLAVYYLVCKGFGLLPWTMKPDLVAVGIYTGLVGILLYTIGAGFPTLRKKKREVVKSSFSIKVQGDKVLVETSDHPFDSGLSEDLRPLERGNTEYTWDGRKAELWMDYSSDPQARIVAVEASRTIRKCPGMSNHPDFQDALAYLDCYERQGEGALCQSKTPVNVRRLRWRKLRGE